MSLAKSSSANSLDSSRTESIVSVKGEKVELPQFEDIAHAHDAASSTTLVGPGFTPDHGAARMAIPTCGSRMQCAFYCTTRLRTILEMKNTGNAASPKYACIPCATSYFALSYQSRPGRGGSEANSQALSTMHKEHPADWNHLVRSMRVKDFEDEPGIGSDAGRSREAVVKFVQSVKQSVACTHRGQVEWLTEKRWNAPGRLAKEGITPDEASAEWKKYEKSDRSRQRNGKTEVWHELAPISFSGHY